MKTIIILILLTSCVYAQDTLWSYPDSTMIILPNNKIEEPIPPATFGQKIEEPIPPAYEFTCPACGSHTLYKDGKDEYFVMCYGRAYWEKEYYSPSAMRRVYICGNCGALYIKLK